MDHVIEIYGLSVWIGSKQIIKEVKELFIPRNTVFAIMGPSGSGKSTLLKVFNRLIELYEGAKVEGTILFDHNNIFHIDAIKLRRRVGMVFQQPNPFPHMSIYDNVAYALKANGIVKDKKAIYERVKNSLEKANLWDEVSDRLNLQASRLSGGQQQRLVIARALALEPEVLLLDEPTSMVDVVCAKKIEETIRELKKSVTIVVVSHNPDQVARISEYVAFIHDGRLIEWGKTEEIFTTPKEDLTDKYVLGSFHGI